MREFVCFPIHSGGSGSICFVWNGIVFEPEQKFWYALKGRGIFFLQLRQFSIPMGEIKKRDDKVLIPFTVGKYAHGSYEEKYCNATNGLERLSQVLNFFQSYSIFNIESWGFFAPMQKEIKAITMQKRF